MVLACLWREGGSRTICHPVRAEGPAVGPAEEGRRDPRRCVMLSAGVQLLHAAVEGPLPYQFPVGFLNGPSRRL